MNANTKKKIVASVLGVATLLSGILYSITSVDLPPFEAVDTGTSNNVNYSSIPAGQVYTVSNSGTESDWIVIDGLKPDGSRVQVKCLRLLGKYILAKNLTVTGCTDHAVFVKGQYIIAENLEVYHNDKRPTGGNWPSALKGEIGAQNIVFRDNVVYENYGEGMDCTMTIGCWGYRNYLRDNWSMGIYADNSENVHFWGNHITNTGNPTYSRFLQNGVRTNGCGLIGAENYTSYGWTTNRIKDIYFRDNYFENCRPISVWNPVGATLVNVNVQDNSFYNTFGGTVNVPNANVSGNVLLSSPPTPTPGGTLTTPSLVPSVTPSKTPTKTVTPSPTIIPTKTSTPVVSSTPTQICLPLYWGSETLGTLCK